MFHFGNSVAAWLLAVAASAAVALAFVWLEFGGASSPDYARDYEDCVGRMQAQGAQGEELNGGLTGCGARFAGRRKADGSGYTYYDFMQDKKFDIAGPNPTAEERKKIDRDYLTYLEGQRREAVSAALAREQDVKLRADLESARQGAAGPLSLAPAAANVPLPVPRRLAEQRGRVHCAEDSLACTLSKLSSAVKDAFASATRTKN
ncbi:hypothetical protein [Bradyrhizobium sp.]|uniref:hypothetical protein n=1 Tax=Bradyrhizobium sp. TaxID=376 RepID=UPI00260C457E|nr:hypothetical protein [Bradyrhizobium sp.]